MNQNWQLLIRRNLIGKNFILAPNKNKNRYTLLKYRGKQKEKRYKYKVK